MCIYTLAAVGGLAALVAICGNGDGHGKGKGRRVPDPRDGKGRRVTSGIIYYLWWRGGGVGGETREGQLPSHSGRTRVRGPGAFRGAFCSHKFREPLDAQPSRGCMTAARRAWLRMRCRARALLLPVFSISFSVGPAGYDSCWRAGIGTRLSVCGPDRTAGRMYYSGRNKDKLGDLINSFFLI